MQKFLIHRKYILATTLVQVILAGCAKPLNIEEDGSVISKIFQVDKTDISYCEFGKIVNEQQDFKFAQGVIALASRELLLLGGDLGDEESSKQITIPVADMKSIGLGHMGAARQIQIALESQIVLIWITKNKAVIDQIGSQVLFDKLVALGVKERATEKFYMPAPTGTFIIPFWLLF